MTVLASVAQQSFAPQTIPATVTVPAGTKELRGTIGRFSWPAGDIAVISITEPDGAVAKISLGGGNTLAKDGTATSKISLRNNGADLATGQYSISVQILQTVTASVLVEALAT